MLEKFTIFEAIIGYLFRTKGRSAIKASHMVACIDRLKEKYPSVEFMSHSFKGNKFPITASPAVVYKTIADIAKDSEVFSIIDEPGGDFIFVLNYRSWMEFSEFILAGRNLPQMLKNAKLIPPDVIRVIDSVASDFYI